MKSNIEQLLYNTVQIKMYKKEECHFATGFFFKFSSESDAGVLSLVTNRHVIEDADKVVIKINFAQDDKPILGAYETFVFDNVRECAFMHPDSKVDLAVLPLRNFFEQHRNYHFVYFDESFIPSESDFDDIAVADNIVMVGYPCAIADEENNLPIFRRGILASPPSIDYRNEKKFLIDAACFPGSSGSPVLLYENKFHYSNNNIVAGDKILLLGVQSATFLYSVTGEIKITTIPTRLIPCAVSQIPNNLGIVVKSSAILDFKPLLFPDAK